MRNSRLLTVLGGRRPYVDTFGALSPRLVPLVGTLAVSGGALQAASAGDWLGNLVANGEFTADTTGWAAGRSTIARVDSATDPGAASGGADNWAVKATVTDASGPAGLGQAIASILGGSYRLSARAYYPTGGAASLKAWFLAGGPSQAASTPDAWQTLTVSGVAATSNTMNLYAKSELGAVVYFDKAECRRQNAAFLVAGWQSPNFVATLDHVSPASPSVVPFSWLCRYADSLNYWEIRVLPNTAGNDLSIIQVTAGVETVRAEADVDWTSNDIDQLRVVAEGAVIGLEHKKAGAGSWTDSASWSAATQGQGAPALGAMLWDTNVPRLASMQVEAR